MEAVFSALSESGKLPQVETKRALLIIDIPNGVLDHAATRTPCQPKDFLQRTRAMIPYYRKLGDLVWVRTENEGYQAKNESEERQQNGQERLMELDGEADMESHREPDQEPEMDHSDRCDHLEDASDDHGLESHAADAPTRDGSSAQAALEIRQRRDHPSIHHQDRVQDAIQSTQQNDKDPLGATLADMLPSLVDESKDLIIAKPHSSAFDSTPLLLSLRMKLITHIYLCGTLTNVAIYDTAADAVRHGFQVTVVEDCLGYHDEQKHVEAMMAMADHLGVSGIDSEEIMQEATGAKMPDADNVLFSKLGLSVVQPAPDAMDEVYDMESDPGRTRELSADAPSDLEANVPEPLSIREALAALRTRRPASHQAAARSPEVIGEGDSEIVHPILPAHLADVAFERVMDEAYWQTMHHRSGEVPRLVAVQGTLGEDGSKPVYRHPADESPPLSAFTATVDLIRREVEKVLQHPLNHVLIQLYRSGHDHISEHSDKTLDIARGSLIANVSLGAPRTMTLRTKKSRPIDRHALPLATPRQSQRISLPHNSMFVLGPATNTHWLHAIRPDRRPPPPGQSALAAQRISLTFRRIATFLDASGTRIWGQGVCAISPDEAHTVSRDPADMRALVRAFGLENQRADTFVWEDVYGAGFDALDMPPAESEGLDRDGGGGGNGDRGGGGG